MLWTILGLLVGTCAVNSRFIDDFDTNREAYDKNAINFNLAGSQWTTFHLKWYLGSQLQSMTFKRQLELTKKAFNLWASSSGLTFERVLTPNLAHIRILDFRRDHGDRQRFDGDGGVLAHAFFPPPGGTEFAGELHLDRQDNFVDAKVYKDDEVDYLTILTHEIGHSLGLQHSHEEEAVMFGAYRSIKKRLGKYDKQGIQKLYPIGGTPPPPITTTTTPSTTRTVTTRTTSSPTKRIMQKKFIYNGCSCGPSVREISIGDGAKTQILTSPNYPANYCGNLNCTWTLKVPEGRNIRLQFNKFETEDDYDHLTVRGTDGAFLQFCTGSTGCGSLRGSNRNELKVLFVTDANTNKKGFLAVLSYD